MTRQPTAYVRSARPADKAAVLRFTEHTWDWGDYLAEVWDEWLVEARSQMLVATLDRRPVGVAHVVMVAPGEAWIEGMRVDPDFRQRGIASALTRRMLAAAVVMGARTIRFATAAANTPVHRMAARLGFRKLSALLALRADAAVGRSGLAPLAPADSNRVFARIGQSPVVAAMGRMASVGWRFRELGPGLVSERLEAGLVKALADGGQIQGLAIFEPAVADVPQAVSCVDAADARLPAMASSLRAAAGQHSPAEVMVWLPEGAPSLAAFTQAGFTPVTDHPIWIFERVL